MLEKVRTHGILVRVDEILGLSPVFPKTLLMIPMAMSQFLELFNQAASFSRIFLRFPFCDP